MPEQPHGKNVAGAIIAGGQSRRFGEANKAEALLHDKPLLEHVFERLSAQSEPVYLNQYSGTLLPQVTRIADAVPGQTGPLNGVLASLQRAKSDGYKWLLIAPCDTPFFPMNLTDRLLESAREHSAKIALPSFAMRAHPSLSLWSVDLVEKLEHAVFEEEAEGFRQFYPNVPYVMAEWPQSDYDQDFDPFFNINYSDDLQDAEKIYSQIS